jgi:hypothetical protein
LEHGKGKYLTMLHIYTDYKITDKPLSDLTVLQYQAILLIMEAVAKFKLKNKPMVVI